MRSTTPSPLPLLLPLLLLLLPHTPALSSPTPSTTPTPSAAPFPLALLSDLSTIEQSLPDAAAPRLEIDDVAVSTVVPFPDASTNDGGLTADPCVSTSDCNNPRKCIQVIQNSAIGLCNTNFDNVCFCFPLDPPFCESTEECDDGEVCARGTEDDAIVPICISEYIVSLTDRLERVDPQRDDDDRGAGGDVAVDAASFEDGCVDVALLPPAHPLVYHEHRKRPVLCDRAGSCATPGHVVVWRGTPMMMRTYCALVPCNNDRRWVNSPRWSRALRIHAPTSGLQFTAFAARYQSGAEERALSLAVRLGL